MQIFLTINSIIRLKICTQINLHFQTLTYIFLQHIPYYIIRQTSSAILADIFLQPGRCFLKTIKCIQYSLLLIENYSQIIIYNFLQSSPRFDNIRIVYCIHGYISPQNVEDCMNLSKYVEVCRSL